MAMITSTASGDFSVGATWVGGVAPADTDGFTVAAGHTVVFDMDQSAWVGMAASVIAATGQLTIKDDGGTYYLKINGDLAVNGTDGLQAGTSVAVPFTGIFTIDFNSGAFSIEGNSTGSIKLYCGEPTNKWIRLSGAEAAAQTELSVDTDVTGDSLWAAGAEVAIVDWIPITAVEDVERRTIAAGGVSSDHIDITAGLTNDKYEGAYVVLLTRNIVIKGSTTWAVEDCDDSEVYAFIDNTQGCNSCSNLTLGGSSFLTNGYAAYNCTIMHYDHALANDGLGSADRGIFNCSSLTTTTDAFIGGCQYGIMSSKGGVYDGIIVGCVNGAYQSGTYIFNNSIWGCYVGLNECYDLYLYEDITASYACLDECSGNVIVANCELNGSYCLYWVANATFYNVLFTASISENYGYDGTKIIKSSVVDSFNHDQIENAFKAWCRGGIVTSDTSAPLPTGETIKYIFTAKDTTQTYPVFRQFETTVQPGTAIEVEGYLAIPNGEDMTGYAPALQIIDKFADPLVDSTQSPLDEDEIPDPDGSETGFQAVSVIWANQGDSPRQVIVRMIAEHDGGGDDVVIYGTWSIADYKDQINDILADTNEIQSKLPDDYIMGSSVTTSKDDEIDAIKANLGQVHTVEDETSGGDGRPSRTSGIAEGCS